MAVAIMEMCCSHDALNFLNDPLFWMAQLTLKQMPKGCLHGPVG